MAEANQEAKDEGGPVLEKSDGRNDQEIEKEIEYGEAGGGGGGFVEEEEMVQKSITEEESDLKYEGYTFHGEAEVPGNHSFDLAQPNPAVNDNGSTHLHLDISVTPLLYQHIDKCEATNPEQWMAWTWTTVGSGPIRTFPRDIGNNLEEIVAHFLEIWSEFDLNVDNESVCNSREQTGLHPPKTT